MTPPHDQPQLFSDLALSRRLERAEGRGSAGFVETRARLAPESGATWIEVAGASAMYDGVKSPITQTFGLGLFQPTQAADLDTIEAFFRDRGAPVYHEVSPLADAGLLPLFHQRGYYPMELSSVMYRPIQSGRAQTAPRNPKIHVRLVGKADQEIAARTSVEGWSQPNEFDQEVYELMRIGVQRPDGFTFLAELGEQPIATGIVVIHEGVALLAGGSTVPKARNQGAQQALLHARLQHAAELGCDLAMMCAQPGSASQRNAERHGFRIAYTRIKWQLAQR